MRFRHGVEPIAPPAFTVPVPVDPAGIGGPTRGQARGPKWRRTGANLYVPSSVDPLVPEQRAVEAAGRLSRDGALSGWAVPRLLQARYFEGVGPDGTTLLPVRLQMGPHNGRRRQEGIEYLYDDIDRAFLIRGIRCVHPVHAVFDEVRLQPDAEEATVLLDMALANGVVTLGQFEAYVTGRAGTRGVGIARAVIERADEHSGSPQETRLRLAWLALGFPRPLVNVAVFALNGRLLGYPDLLDPQAGLVVEYDGADHRSARRHSDDVDREARFRAVRLEVTRVTGADLRKPDQLARRLHAARGRAPFELRESRRWTLEPVR